MDYDEFYRLPATYKSVGSVTKELRALSIIEKEHLISLVGLEKVDELMNSPYYAPTELKVKPGTYTFILSSAPEFVTKEIKNESFQSVQWEENTQELKDLVKNKKFRPHLILQGLDVRPKKKLKI